jgi:hypothetical protein
VARYRRMDSAIRVVRQSLDRREGPGTEAHPG